MYCRYPQHFKQTVIVFQSLILYPIKFLTTVVRTHARATVFTLLKKSCLYCFILLTHLFFKNNFLNSINITFHNKEHTCDLLLCLEEF